MLAAKTALAVRYDALGEEVNTEMGVENRARLEIRIRNIEEGKVSTDQLYYSYYFVPHFNERNWESGGLKGDARCTTHLPSVI